MQHNLSTNLGLREISEVTLKFTKKKTGCFIMFSMITNIYNKETKEPTLMEFFTATGKLIRYSSCCHTRVNMLTRVWQQLEYRIDVCRVTRGAHIERL